MKKTDRKFLAIDMIRNHDYACFDLLLYSAFYGGIRSNRYSKAVYDVFVAGGIPCGWLGSRNFEVLDKLESPVMLLHFGSSVE